MSVIARSAFLACLSLVLGQLALPQGGSAAAGGMCVVRETVQFDHAPHPATVDARTWVADRLPDRFGKSPLASARSAEPRPASTRAEVREHRGCAHDSSDVFLVPPARAPPVLF
jgi:hypothetical protein